MTRPLIFIVTALVTGLGWALWFIGLAGVPDNASEMGRILQTLGPTNIVAIFGIGLLGIVLWRDHQERQQTNAKMRVMGSYFPGTIISWWRKVRFLDPWLGIGFSLDQTKGADDLTRGQMRIDHLRARLQPITLRRIAVERCYARSRVTGETVEGEIRSHKHMLPATLKRGEACDFYMILPQPLSIAEFRQRWISFDIVAEHSLGQSRLRYPREFVDWMLYDYLTALSWGEAPELLDE